MFEFFAGYLCGPLPAGWWGVIAGVVMLAFVVWYFGLGNRVVAWILSALAICAGVVGFVWVCSHFSSGQIALGAGVVVLVCGGLLAWAEKK